MTVQPAPGNLFRPGNLREDKIICCYSGKLAGVEPVEFLSKLGADLLIII